MPVLTEVLSVSDITKQIKYTLEQEFQQIYVQGEISNFKPHAASGHWYFNLKDANAMICCTMWRSYNNYLFFTPQDGMKVTVSGRVTVYPVKGSYQLDVRSMQPAGEGELQAAFELLKRKLSEEGLFRAEFKKEIPNFPEKIGIVTAIDGAAFKDMISVAKRRYPLTELVIVPARVQGSGAAESICEGIDLLNKREDIDVIIIGRGGGSVEDLWAFNEEIVARAIFESVIPIISGVGHEIDYTIADFAADVRAATPTAAMELATPDINEIFAFINDFSYTSSQNLSEICVKAEKSIKSILDSYGFRKPADLIHRHAQTLDNLVYRIYRQTERNMMIKSNKLALLSSTIESHNIDKTLRKGFTLIKQDSKIIKSAAEFNPAGTASVKFYDGEVEINKY